MAEQILVDEQHPWPWLDAFPETAQRFFNGRDADARQVVRSILAAPALVLFGRSGLGKTSLLQAGVCPALRARRQLPVVVRLDHGAGCASLGAQLLNRLLAEAAGAGLRLERPDLPADAPAPTDRSIELWELLHDSQARWLDADAGADSEAWTPVFMLDQFEEAFTLRSDDAVQDALCFELGDLVEGRIPAAVAQRLGASAGLRKRLSANRLGARFVLSLREDFLPDLEAWIRHVPRLGEHRYRLLPMQREQALEAILKTGGPLVSAEDAGRIADFLGRQSALDTRRSAHIEPALLSLVCAGLNQARLHTGAERLDTSDLEAQGGRLLERFYDDAFAALPAERQPGAMAMVERELITSTGTRRPFPRRDALAAGLSEADLETLTRKRLLRLENTEQGDYIELVHDRVAAIAAQRAGAARERAALAAQQAERARDEARRRQRRRLFAWTAALVLMVALAGLVGVAIQWQKAEAERSVAFDERSKAQTAARELQNALTQAEQSRAEADNAASQARASAYAASAARQDAVRQAEHAEAETRKARQAERQARQAADLARTAELAASEATGRALLAARDATAQRLLSEGADMVRGSREGNGLQGLLMVLAAHQQAKQATPYVLSASYAALQEQAAQLQPLMWIQETGERLEALAVSPDGQRIATASRAEAAPRLWDTRTGQPLPAGASRAATGVQGPAAEPSGDSLTSLAFSPDGQLIATGTRDGSLRLWNGRTGQPQGLAQQVQAQAQQAVKALAFSPDGAWLVAGHAGGQIQLWDARAFKAVGAPMAGHTGWVTALAFSADGQRFASAGADGTVRQWHTQTGQSLGRVMEGHGAAGANSVAYSPDGSRIASGGGDGALVFWSALTGRMHGRPQRQHTDAVSGIGFSADGRQLITASDDGSLRLWDAVSGKPQDPPLLRTTAQTLQRAVLLPGRRQLVSGGADGLMRLWQLRSPSGGASLVLTAHRDGAHQVAVSADGLRLASAGQDGTVRLWNAQTGQPAGDALTGHDAPVRAVAFSPDGRLLVSGAANGSMQLWNIAGQARPVGRLVQAHGGGVQSLAFSPDGESVLSAGADGLLRLWDLDSTWPDAGSRSRTEALRRKLDPRAPRTVRRTANQSLPGHAGGVQAAIFSPDGQRIASIGRDRSLRLWQTDTGEPLQAPISLGDAMPLGVAFSPDGQLLAVGTAQGSATSGATGALHLWDGTGQPQGRPVAFSDPVTSLAFSPDGTRLLLGSQDRQLRLWNIRSSQPSGRALEGHDGGITSSRFSPDGRYAISASLDGTLRIWPVLEGWADVLCAKLPRNMSPDEWREHGLLNLPYDVQCPGRPVPAP